MNQAGQHATAHPPFHVAGLVLPKTNCEGGLCGEPGLAGWLTEGGREGPGADWGWVVADWQSSMAGERLWLPDLMAEWLWIELWVKTWLKRAWN